MGCSVNTIFKTVKPDKNIWAKAFGRNSPQGISFCGTVPALLDVLLASAVKYRFHNPLTDHIMFLSTIFALLSITFIDYGIIYAFLKQFTSLLNNAEISWFLSVCCWMLTMADARLTALSAVAATPLAFSDTAVDMSFSPALILLMVSLTRINRKRFCNSSTFQVQ